MTRLKKEFSGDYRVMRVVFSTDNPMETLHKIKTNQYSVRTFLDMLELLDVKTTLEEDEYLRGEEARKNIQK